MRGLHRGIGIGWVGLLVLSAASMAIDHPMLGEVAPAFELRSLDGDTVRSEDFRGNHVVLHFGAGW